MELTASPPLAFLRRRYRRCGHVLVSARTSRDKYRGAAAILPPGFSIHVGTAHVYMPCPSNAPAMHTNHTTVAFSSENTRTNVADSFTEQAVRDWVDVGASSFTITCISILPLMVSVQRVKCLYILRLLVVSMVRPTNLNLSLLVIFLAPHPHKLLVV